MPSDITKYGISGLKGLKGLNQQPTNDNLQQALLERQRYATGNAGPSLEDTSSMHPYDLNSQMGQWGTSGYDDQFLNAPLTDEQVQDTRYENQPWYDSLANGVVKMLGTAGTTFLSSLVGLPVGIGTAAAQGRWSGLWDNAVTNALGDVDDWLEKNFQNYKSVEQEQNKWWQNLDTMNFWADDVIKNAGFTLGAAASMAVGAGGLGLLSKSLGLVNNASKAGKMATNVVSALFSATGEGMIEARNGVEERNKLELQRLQDAFAPEREALDMERELINQEYAQTGDYNAYQSKMSNLIQRQQELDNRFAAGQQEIEESGKLMGNKILLGNQALLTAGNLIQFGKAMTKSFDRARHAAEVSSKAVKPTLVRVARTGEDIAKGYTVKGKNLGRAWAIGKGVLTEGSEEMNQQWIQNTAGEMYNEKDVNDYWRAKLDPDSYRETTKDLYSLGNMISQGFKDSWGDADQWEQFVIGGITGMAGSYSPTKLMNQDKTKSRLDPRRYGEWAGGAYNELKDFNEQYSQYAENIDDLNKVLADENFFSRVQNLVARTYSETKKQEAAENNDKKTWKDEDDKQTIHDIQAFLRAGKLDDLRTIYDNMGEDLSDDDVKEIIKSTTREIENEDGTKRYEGPFVDKDNNQTVSNDDIRKEIKHNSEEMQRKIDSYLDSIDYVNQRTGGQLSKDQEDNLAYLHNLGRESLDRADKIMQDVRQSLPQKFLIKTNKSAEQLAQENTSSDLTFNKDDSTPEGYVEVDTSLMNDRAFSDFFIRDILWGGNIRSEFGETADERARREEEEKNLSEEEKKKRLTARGKKLEEEAKKDAAEQYMVNSKLIVDTFENNYKKEKRATEAETREALDEFKNNIRDAIALVAQAGQFEKTLQDYLLNPEKVDQDKAKEEKKAEKQAKKDEVKGMSVRDLSNRDDLNELFSEAQKENDITLMNKIKKAQVLREKKANLDAADGESNLNGADVSDEENAALEILRQQVENDIDDDSTIDDKKAQTAKELTNLVADVDEGLIDNYVDEHAVVNIDPKTGAKTLSLKRGALSPEERSQQAQFEAENPEEYDRQKAILIDRIHNSVRSIDDRMDEALSKIDDTDIVSEDVAKMQKYTDKVKEDENLPDIEPEKKNDRNNPVQTVPNTPETPIERRPVDGIGEEAALTSDMRQGTENGLQVSSNSGHHPWQIISGRVGYHTNEPYSNTLRKLVEDPNVSEENKKIYRKQLKRAEAVEKFLSNEESGAYTRVENGGAQRRSTVKFKVFRKVNEAAEDFVIFITDDKGNILGDLPSSDLDIDPNTEKRTGLAVLYEEARKQLDENADAAELELKGIESEIDFEYIGKPQYRKEGEPRKTVNELFNNGEFTLALKVSDNNEDNPVVKVDTGKKSFKGKLEMDAIKDPLTGNVGQPYILIPTSQAARKNNTGRGYWAVPIATPAFGEIDKSSVFYRTVKQTLESIRDGKLSETEAKTRLGELFGVANFHVNFTEGESKKEPGIRATTYIRQDGSEKGAPHTLYVGDRASMDVETVLNELGRFFINISNSKINSKETYTTVDGTSYTYNQMIGEIATTDAVRPHTVNDWFTIRPVEKKGNKWIKSETPTQRIPYPSGSEKAVFHVTIPYQDGTKHVWTISPRDWTVRDEQGRPIMYKDGIHSEEETNVAAIQMARAFGRYYMKDMSKPYVVLVGEQSRLFDPTNNTFKAAQELEEAPKYKKGQSFSSAEAEYDFLTTIEQARAEKAAGGGSSNAEVTPQQIGQDMATHLKGMGIDVELVDDANKAAEGIEDAQLSVEELDEMEQIKKNAKADGTFMKAPNGKPTNLTERQWLQVRTKAFKKWFGDWENDPANASKIVDKNGEPLVVYHGSPEQFTMFDISKFGRSDNGTIGKGFYFTSKKERTNYYGENLMPVFISAKNPIDGNQNEALAFVFGSDSVEDAKERLFNGDDAMTPEEKEEAGSLITEDLIEEAKKHDGTYLSTRSSKFFELLVNNPNQIKSATENTGEYSNENPDINMLKVDGKILGFEHNGKLYLQKDALNPNLPMHEYTHLWDRVIRTVDPRLWNRGKELMKTEAADLWKQIAEDENYGKRWKEEGKTGEELEDLIASEVHARLTGNGFEEYAKKHPNNSFAKLKKWLIDAFKKLASTLGLSDEQVKNLTLSDWNNMTVRDFMEKSITMNTIQEEAQKAINRERTEATIKKIKEDSADFVLTDGNGNEDPNGDYYKNKKTGELHARVTSVKEGDTRVLPFNETDAQGNRNPWITPSTTIGNAVDEFVRLFFEGQDPESSVLTQNLSDKTKQHLREELEKIQKSLGTKWKVAASGIKAVGSITVKDANGDDMVIRVAGTLDLLLYNPEKNEYAIYDMKTHRGGVEDKKLGWAAQLSLYKQLLEAKYPEMRGKIKGLKIVPFTTSGYDANKQSYDTDDSGRLTSNGEIVKAEVKYDGSTIDMTKDEMNLNISFARPGFKKEYVSGVGASKIIVSKPQPKLEEAPKERVKEGFVKSINKIANNDSVKTFLKPKFRDNKEAITLAEKLDKARKDGNLGELCLTLGEMNLLQDMLNTRMIDRVAARSEMIDRGLDVPAAETPEADVAEGSQDIDAIAEEKGILSTATRKAWNKLTDENKEKIVQLRRGVKDVKKELKECQRLGKDPNSAIAGYLHRKADETSGYTIIDMKKELAWLDRVLPKLSKEGKVRIIEGLIKCSDGTFDYGQIKQGLVYIAINGKEGTVYHEAFHAVTQWILTDNELDRLYKAAKERYGNLDTVVLEEKLADDFMRYTMGFEPSYKKHDLNIFQKLWQAIKNMFKHTSMIDKLYRDINDGIYADSVLRTNNNEFAHITEEDRQVSMKYQFLNKEQQQRLKDEKISQEQYEVLDADEKRYLFHCVI